MVRDEPSQNPFDAVFFVKQALSSPARPLHAVGLAARSITQAPDALNTAARAAGLDVVVIDCARSEHSVSDAIRRRLATLQAAHGLDPATLRIAEAVERSTEASETLRVDGLARLWMKLNAAKPALVVVLNAAEASATDEFTLRHFATYVYSDPVAKIAPEAGMWTAPAGRLVFIGAPSFEADLVTVDFGEVAATAIRDFLGREDVVRRFLASTDGDLERLGELVDQLPRNASHMALFRYDACQPHERAIIDILAIADHGVAPDHLHDAVALLGASEFFAKSLRRLEDVSLIHKSMGAGRIVVALDDPGFGSALVARFDDEHRAAAHRAFADAERHRHPDDPDVELLATHYCAAGDAKLALQYGQRAVARLRRNRRHPQARRLCEALLEHARGDVRDALEMELAHSLEDLGEFRAALEACGRIESADLELTLRQGRLLARVGEWDAAIVQFELVIGADSEGLRRDALLARADAAYSIGDHDTAVDQLTALVTSLASLREEPSVRDRALLAARNTLGKIGIVRSEFAAAAEHFEANREMATNWGWDDEVSRAQANLGVVALQRDDHDEALDRLVDALACSDSHGSLPRAYCLMNLASVYQRRDQYHEALDHCLDAMRCAKKVGDRAAYSVSARNLATIYQDLGAYERATGIVEHLHQEFERDDQTLAGGWNLLVRAQLLLDTGDHEAAQSCFERLRSARLAPVFGTEATIRLAEIHFALGHVERAASEIASADLGERALYQGLAGLLRAELALGTDAKFALELAQTAYETLEEVGEKNEPIRARLVMASALEALGRPAEARTELQRELARVRRVAAHVPPEFERSFWAKPLNGRLVARLQQLDGDVPTECLNPEPVLEKTEAHDAEFWAWRSRYTDVVGEDPRLHQVFRLIDRVARSSAPVLAYGESGTGKELVAAALHRHSDRANKPFVKVNCAAFVENLLLSELFGHEKGAFTGAADQKQGRFERAHGGTIFLDEIGDISPNTQVALLRVLQEGTFERVGGTQTIQTDVRVVCATNKDLEEMVRRGEFRLDLYYRLKGVVIEMPALRDRRADIGRLANHFAATLGTDGTKWFATNALQFLANYSWPGNVRELQNFVRSILLFVDGSVIELDDILEFRDFFVSGDIDRTLPPLDFDTLLDIPERADELMTVEEERSYTYRDPADALADKIVSEGRSLSDIKRQLEIECIKRALIETDGNVTQAADILQMKRPRLSQIINGDEELSALKTRLTG